MHVIHMFVCVWVYRVHKHTGIVEIIHNFYYVLDKYNIKGKPGYKN